jgi:nucleoid DNA-binding protein
MSKILYEVYQNDIKDSESVMFGKWYARLKSIETLSTEKLAQHISEHGSVFTADVVDGVMKKVKTCLLEMLLESKKVKIAGLGTFYLTCECQKGGTDNTGGGTNTGGGSDDTGGDDDGDDGLDKD